MLIRLPVTSRRRCEQMTAFGASDVPLVKISAHGVSTSGSRPGSSVAHGGERGLERVADHEHRRELVADRREEVEVAGLGDDEPAVGVLHVAAAGARRAGCG